MIDLDSLRDVSLLNVREEEYNDILLNQRFEFTKRIEPGTIFLLRKKRGAMEDYGIMGIWYVSYCRSILIRGFRIEIKPLIRFNTPFSEDFTGNKSSKIRNVKNFGMLANKKYIEMKESGLMRIIFTDYFKNILKEKGTDEEFEDWYIEGIITDNVANYFIEKLCQHVEMII